MDDLRTRLQHALESNDRYEIDPLIRELLSALDTVTAERDRYRTALERLTQSVPVVPVGAFSDIHLVCAYCGFESADQATVRTHKPSCPWRLARAALDDPAGGAGVEG